MSSYHGWTHAPKSAGGTDPIPNLGALPYAYMVRSAGYTLTSGSLHNPWNVAADVSTNTSDASILSPDDTNGQIDVLAIGIYLVSIEYTFSVSGAWSKKCDIAWNTGGDVNADYSIFEQSPSWTQGFVSGCDFLHLYALSGTDNIVSRVGQLSGVDRVLQSSYFKVVQLAPL